MPSELRGEMLRVFNHQPWCLNCGNALIEQSSRWTCIWCGSGGSYTHIEHRGRKVRVRVVEHVLEQGAVPNA